MFKNALSTTILLLIIPIMLIFFIVRYSKKTSINRQPLPPGPTPLPFFGCIIQMLLNKPTFKWIHKLMDQFNTPILCVRLGPSTHVIFVTSPTIACEFFKKQDAVFASRPDILSAFLASDGYRASILTPFGTQWKKMRGILNHHIVSSPVHKWLRTKRDEEADHLLMYICNQIKKQDTATGGGLVNIRITSQQFCGNIIRKMVFGKRFFGEGLEDGGPGDEERQHVAAILTILNHLYAFCISDYFPWLRFKADFDGHEKIVRTAIETVRKYQDPLVDERIQMWKNGVRNEKDDLLDVLILHENPKLTPEEIKAQIVELMIATIDNPSNAIEWAMAEMINEPKIMKRAVEELENVVGCNRLVEEHDLPQLNYIKACVKEAFRLHPFLAFNPPHVSVMNTTVAGYFIPKGSHVLLSRLGLGRNPNVWMDPMKFEPERHLSVEGKQVVLSDNDLRMVSFSTGKRGCPGVVLGSTISTMLLARMVQGFTWEAPHNESGVNLAENHDGLGLAKPLVAIAKPRLPRHLYRGI